MDLQRTRDELEDRLAPAGESLARQRRQDARRRALNTGVVLLPRQTAVLVVAFLGVTYVLGQPPLTPWALPPLVLLAALANAVAIYGRDRSRWVDSGQAALAVDEHHDTHDRVSAALDLAGRADTGDDSRRAALARAAVDDGVTTLRGLDAHVTTRPAALVTRRAPLGLALVLALVPAVLLRALDAVPSGPPAADRIAGRDADRPTPPAGRDPGATPEAEPATDADPATPPRRSDTAREHEPPATTEQSPTPPPGESPQARRGTGEGAAGAAGADTTPRTTPSSSEASSAARGDARSSSSSGGGSEGASQSENPPEEREPRAPRERTQQPKKPSSRPSETRRGDPEQSAGAPSGPSSSGGTMTAVANERSGFDRGSPRDEDTADEDEEIEDEEEESEQRGGLMPSTRDNMQPPSRELSISGSGPPSDGRGGPTPPKKSRGTASLVLGIRLPDQVRGQPNPGTAKTTIEQIPPVPRDAARRPAIAAPPERPSPHPQSEAPPRDAALTTTVRRYHELLKKNDDS